MAKLQSTFKNMFLSLFIICLTVALLLAQVNKMTAKAIADASAMKLQNAIKEVVPAFDNDPVADAYWITDTQGDSLLLYPAKKGDTIVGYALNSFSDKGFGGNIQIIIGFDTEDRIVNYAVLQHAETPGLGSKMTTWFKNPEKPSQSIIGRDLSQGLLAVTKDGGNGGCYHRATITSRAFLEAVNKAYSAYSGIRKDALSGATTKNVAETSDNKAHEIKEEEDSNE